jgi:hypothetical protein
MKAVSKTKIAKQRFNGNGIGVAVFVAPGRRAPAECGFANDVPAQEDGCVRPIIADGGKRAAMHGVDVVRFTFLARRQRHMLGRR